MQTSIRHNIKDLSEKKEKIRTLIKDKENIKLQVRKANQQQLKLIYRYNRRLNKIALYK